MSYASNQNLNQRLSYVEFELQNIPVPPFPTTSDLAQVLLNGNSAGATDINMNNQDILQVNNIDLVTINGSVYPPAVSTLADVLLAGNNAGGTDINMNNNGILDVSLIEVDDALLDATTRIAPSSVQMRKITTTNPYMALSQSDLIFFDEPTTSTLARYTTTLMEIINLAGTAGVAVNNSSMSVYNPAGNDYSQLDINSLDFADAAGTVTNSIGLNGMAITGAGTISATSGLTVPSTVDFTNAIAPTCVANPQNGLDLCNKNYVDSQAALTAYQLYFNYSVPYTVPGGATYTELSPTQIPTPTTVAWTTNSTSPVLLGSFFNSLTGLNIPASIPAGVWTLLIYANLTSLAGQGREAFLYEIYGTTALGAETLLYTSPASLLLNTIAPLIGSVSIQGTVPLTSLAAYTGLGIKLYIQSNTASATTGSIVFQTPNAYSSVLTSFAVVQAPNLLSLNNTWTGTNNFTSTLLGNLTGTTTNLAGGLGGSIPYQSAVNTTALLANGTAAQVLTSAGTTLPPTWTTLPTTISTATNLAGGIASQIPYQSSTGTTAFIANGTAGQVLTSAGTAVPTWTTGVAEISVTDTNTSATYYPTFVDSSGTGKTLRADISTGPFSINPNTGDLRLGSSLKLDASNVSVAVGSNAGLTTQGASAVAIGISSGQTTQGASAVAIGNQAGQTTQSSSAIAIGNQAGKTTQGANSVAIGISAGTTSQGSSAIAIGSQAGNGFVTGQGANAIAIGSKAGINSQTAGSICLNASGLDLDPNQAGCFINPIRNASQTTAIGYDATTKEITYYTPSTTATNLAGGIASQIPYQSSAGVTAFIANGTAGQVLTSAGTAVPTWSTVPATTLSNVLLAGNSAGATDINMNSQSITGALSVSSTTFTGALTGNASTATQSTNIAGGLGGSIPYQSALNTTALLANGTAGQVLTSAGTTLAPTWGSAPAASLATVMAVGASASTALNMATFAITNAGVIGATSLTSTLNCTIAGLMVGNGLNNNSTTNTAFGQSALRNTTTTVGGISNVAFGASSLINNVSGTQNTAVGREACGGTTSAASNNTAVGYRALYSASATISGTNNTAIGVSSGNTNTSGSNNTYLGTSADQLVGTYSSSTAVGYNSKIAGSNQIQMGTTSETVIIPGYVSSNNFTSDSVNFGVGAGKTTSTAAQAVYSVAIGNLAGNNQQRNSTAVGALSQQTGASQYCTALGQGAGNTNQGALAGAGFCLAVGNSAGATTQGQYATAVGASSGNLTQGSGAVAVGYVAGEKSQGIASIAIGRTAGNFSQGAGAVAIGSNAGKGTSGTDFQGANAVAIGINSGAITQGGSAVAIGDGTGQTTQGSSAVAIGISSGSTTQGASAVAIGNQAGQTTQSGSAVAIGNQAGKTTQGANSVAIGISAGLTSQGSSAIAIGAQAGMGVTTGQGSNAIAIGNKAGINSQTAGSICLNASGLDLNPNQAGCFIRPIRGVALGLGVGVVFYDTTTFELQYSTT